MANTGTQPSKSKVPAAGIVELKPPPETGFTGTAKFDAVEQAVMIEELLKRGYTRVER